MLIAPTLSSFLVLNRAVNLAHLAYRTPTDISLAFDGYERRVKDYAKIRIELESVHGMPTFYDDTLSGVQALLCKIGVHEYALCIRGTDSVKDFFFDAHFVQSSLDKGVCKVHTGMKIQQRRLMTLCERDIHECMRSPQSKLSIIGHSCGAGIGLITAHRLSRVYDRRVDAIAFGCPRVGNLNFAKSLIETLTNSSICVVKHGNDPVPDLPPFRAYVSPEPTVLTGGAVVNGNTLRWCLRDHAIEAYERGIQELNT